MSSSRPTLRLAAAVVDCGDVVVADVVAMGAVDVALCRALETAGLVERDVLDRCVVSTDGAGTSVTLAVPEDGPITYEGRLLQVRWWVEARPAGGDDATEPVVVPLTVVPVGGVALWARRAGPPPSPGGAT